LKIFNRDHNPDQSRSGFILWVFQYPLAGADEQFPHFKPDRDFEFSITIRFFFFNQTLIEKPVS
jgi:hypothetical protein